jgi:hypothetical protein
MFEYQQYESFIDGDSQLSISKFMHEKMPWKYVEKISGINPDQVSIYEELPLARYQNGFTGFIYSDEVGSVQNSEAIDIVKPLTDKIHETFPFPVEIIRIRAGLFTNCGFQWGVHTPHVDMFFPHYTALYYVDDTDGDTFLYKEKSPVVDFEVIPEYPSMFNVSTTFAPKMGSALIFNGLIYHSSSPPQLNSHRIAINVNIVPKF